MIVGQPSVTLWNKTGMQNSIGVTNTIRNMDFDKNQFNTEVFAGDKVTISLAKLPEKTFFATLDCNAYLSNSSGNYLTIGAAGPYICDESAYKNTKGSTEIQIIKNGTYIVQSRFNVDFTTTTPYHTSVDHTIRFQLYSNSAALYETSDMSFTFPTISGGTHYYGIMEPHITGVINSVLSVSDDLDSGKLSIKAFGNGTAKVDADIIPSGSNIIIRGPI